MMTSVVHVDGIAVHTERWTPVAHDGNDGVTGGAPVLLVHGLGGSTINWHLVGQTLADGLGADVTAVDLIGFGRTPLDGRRSTISENAALVRALLTDLDGPAVVVANSMGGSIAVRVAAHHPELVNALVLANPALPFARGRPSRRTMWNLAVFLMASVPGAGPWMIDTRARRLGAAKVVDASLRASGIEPAELDPGVRDAFVELTDWRSENADASRAYHDAIRSLLAYITTAMPADVAAVQAPTLVVHGREDDLVPLVLANAVSKRRPEWQVELLDCGHLPPLQAPEAFVDLVTRFCAGVAPAVG
jgi:pimeloyl-ACP methyl ester carboxylesterase